MVSESWGGRSKSPHAEARDTDLSCTVQGRGPRSRGRRAGPLQRCREGEGPSCLFQLLGPRRPWLRAMSPSLSEVPASQTSLLEGRTSVAGAEPPQPRMDPLETPSAKVLLHTGHIHRLGRGCTSQGPPPTCTDDMGTWGGVRVTDGVREQDRTFWTP